MDTLVKYVDDLLVVIVLYKTALSESRSYQSIRNGFRPYVAADQRITLIVVNNGPDRVNCQVDERVFRPFCIEQLDNPGVSKAYNVAAGLAARLGKRWLLILDQDTHLPDDFWSYYEQALAQHPNLPLYAPRLRAGSVLASPCGYQFYRGYVLPDIAYGIQPMKGHNVLNSGLLLSLKAFVEVGGYDESVRLYFSDFVFFNRLKRQYDAFAVVDVALRHDLSSSDYSNQLTAKHRFALYCEGAYAAAKGKILPFALYFLTVGARSLVMNRRFRTLAFTRIFLQTWFLTNQTKLARTLTL